MKKKILLTFILILMSIFAIGTTNVLAATTVNVSTVAELQSAHNYNNNMDTTWIYTHPTDADSLDITFSSSTATEARYDYIYIYDGGGNQIGKYDGTTLAGKTITVPGNIVKIRLTSDSSSTKYGFSVMNINAIVLSGPITDFTLTAKTMNAFSFAFSNAINATSVSIEYSVDGIVWNTAQTSEMLSSESTVAIVENIEFGVEYLYRLNAIGGKREGISNVVSASIKSVAASDVEFSDGVITKYTGSDTFIVIPETINGVPVIGIGGSAFENNDEITDVTLPTSIKTIGERAFYSCSKLANVNIPEGIEIIADFIFYDCDKLTTVVLPKSIISIGKSAFRDCASLTEITIPESVSSIGDLAFGTCDKLSTVYWNARSVNDFTATSTIFYTSSYSGKMNIIFGDSVERIPAYCFYKGSNSAYTKSLSVTIGKNVTDIGKYAFYNCIYMYQLNWNAKAVSDFPSKNYIFYCAGSSSGGVAVTFGDEVEKIPAYCFHPGDSSGHTPRITTLTLGENVATIGKYAFWYSSYLTAINWNAVNVADLSSSDNIFTNMGKSANGIKIVFGDKVERIPARCLSTGSGSSDSNTKITSVTLGKNVKEIGASAFAYCTGLSQVTLGENITKIESGSFSGCSKLGSIIIPDSVSEIGSSAFSGCSNLTSATIGKNVKKVGASAFYNCKYLNTINWNAKNVEDFPEKTEVFNYAGQQGNGIHIIFGTDVEHIPEYLLYYSYSSAKPKVTKVSISDSITSIGTYAFYNPDSLTDVYLTDLKSYMNISFGDEYYSRPTRYAENLYLNGTLLTEVIVPDGVMKIEDGIFRNNINITNVVIPESVEVIGNYAFYGCSTLSSINIPDSVTFIGNSAFRNCTSLTSIDIPNRVTNISPYVFYGCTKLEDITINGDVTDIGGYAFYNCSALSDLNIPNSVTTIGEQAFRSCIGLTSVAIPDSVTTIGKYAFSGCSGLTSINIPKGITVIEEDTFYCCSKLTGIIIPDGVTTIGNYAFSGCSGFTNITIPDSVTTIGNYAFSNCTNLATIEMGVNVQSIGTDAFKNTAYSKEGNNYINGVMYAGNMAIACDPTASGVITVKEGTTSIVGNAFYNCTGITGVIIPDSVISIGSSAFYNCTGLTSVSIGSGITKIEADAFKNCTGLTEVNINDVVSWCGIEFANIYANPLQYAGNLKCNSILLGTLDIPDSVETIGKYAFYNCTSLTSVVFGDGITKIDTDAFYECTNINTVTIKDIDKWCEISFGNSNSNPLQYAKNLYNNEILTSTISVSESVERINAYAFYKCSAVTGVTLSDAVTTIDSFAFYGCPNLSNVTIPNNTEIIYGNSFAACTKLKTINIDSENPHYIVENGILYNKGKTCILTVLAGSGITSVTIPESVTSIDSYAFDRCTSITYLNIGNFNTNPAPGVWYYITNFDECVNLKHIEYYGTDKDFFRNVSEFKNLETVIIPNVSGDSYFTYFRGMSSLKYVDISNFYLIADNAFRGCTNLETVISTAYSIGEYAFYECEKLNKIFLCAPYATASIGKYAFYNCDSLYEVSFPATTQISDYAFSGCDNLKQIYISTYSYYFNSGNTISNNAFNGVTATVYYPKGININYSSSIYGDFGGSLNWNGVDYGTCATNAKWQYDENTATLTLYGSGKIYTAWPSGNDTPWRYLNNDIKKVVVQNGITEIYSYIFEFLKNAEEIILPDTLEYLAYNAFNDCYKLNNLIIPSSVKRFNQSTYGFNRCNALTDVYYVGKKEEFEQIPNYSYATQNGQTIHFLVWNEPSATCTEAGVEGYYSFDDISVYNTKYDTNKNVKTYLNSVPATGHNIVWMEEISANCHETGKKERFECENCGTIYIDQYGSTERTDAILEINPDNHDGETELRDVTDGFTGNTYCLGCERIIASGESIYKIKIYGTSTAAVGSTDILKAVEVGTDKDVNALYCFIKYPDTLTLKSVTAKDFAYAGLEDEYTVDGFTTAVILAQYSETELIPKNVIHTPFELTFDLSKSANPGSVQIEATEESCLIGNDTYFFEERTPGSLVIEPKLTEGIEISGADIISSETTYTAIISPDYTTNKDVEWSVDNEEVATVSENGVVTPVTSGTFILTATAKDGSGVTASKTITVTRGVASIEIVGVDSITEATTYSVIITPSYATSKEVEWSISNSEIATIDQNGIVTPITSGLVTITATAKDGSGISASKEINIIKLAESIVITGEDSISSPAQYTATVLPNYTSDKEVIWSIDNEKIATVDELGIVTPVTSGKIILTATAKDGSGVISSKTIEIVKIAESIEIVGSEEITEPSQYSVVILPEYTTNKDAEWSVSDETVATVDENGVVTPIKNGKIVLTAKALDASGIETTKSIVITVSVRANSITSDIGEWDNEFDSDITEYIINVPSGTTAVYLTSSFENATAKVNGSIALNGVRKKVTLTGKETDIELVLTPTSGNNLSANTYKITVICGSFTKTTVSNDGKSFTVVPVNIENGKTVILALYDGEKFIEMQSAVYTGEEIPFITTKAYTNAKVMVWNDLRTLKPVCNVEIVK